MPVSANRHSQSYLHDVGRMLDVDHARERILSAFSPLPPVDIPIGLAVGLVTSEDVIADVEVPPFNNSAMDGYAVQARDTEDATIEQPTQLTVIGEVAAGQYPNQHVERGTAIRIMTGAPIPPGADAVVRFEHTDEQFRRPVRGDNSRVTVGIKKPVVSRENIRLAGEDLAIGKVAIERGSRLRPAHIGLLAALNREKVKVHRRPLVAILSTGDEVVGLRETLKPGQIRDTNSYVLWSMVARWGGRPAASGIVGDSVAELTAMLSPGSDSPDLIVTSGGVSAGDFDVVKNVLAAQGEIDIWQVRMKPGKPLAFGRIGETPVLGIPGNPVAAAVSFEQFGRPAILKMLGRHDVEIPTVQATLTERVENHGHRRHFVRAIVSQSDSGAYMVKSAGDQGAGVLSSLARANGLLVIPEEIEVAEVGMVLPVQMNDWDLG
jgi:molybdopterin molybdotransferase